MCGPRPVPGLLWWLMGSKGDPVGVKGARGKDCVVSTSVQKV